MTRMTPDRLLSAVFLPLTKEMRRAVDYADLLEKRRLAGRAKVSLMLLMPVFHGVGGVSLIRRPAVRRVMETGKITDDELEQFLREASQQIEATVLLLEHQ